jgi:hypothetical protein
MELMTEKCFPFQNMITKQPHHIAHRDNASSSWTLEGHPQPDATCRVTSSHNSNSPRYEFQSSDTDRFETYVSLPRPKTGLTTAPPCLNEEINDMIAGDR